MGLHCSVFLPRPLADAIHAGDVRYWHLADIKPLAVNVRFRGKADMPQIAAREKASRADFAGAFLTGLNQPLAMLLMRIGLSTTNAMTAAMMLRIAAT